jgi:hypothetical protein
MLIEVNELQKLDQAIDNILTKMLSLSPDSEEHAKMADQLTKLTKNKETIANIKLKTAEVINKQDNDTNALRVKEEEIVIRRDELAARKEEAAKTSELRELEIQHRNAETVIDRALKNQDLELRRDELDIRRHVSKDTLAIVGANIAGIALILSYERMNVVASKALSFITKLR